MEKEKQEETQNEDALSSHSPTPVPCILSKRWVLAYIGMLGFFVLYSLRVNISVAIICMVKDTNETDTDTDTGTNNSKCGSLDPATNGGNRGQFDWDKTTVSMILSSFFYGYLVTQILGGWVAGKFGGKMVLGGGILITSLATILLPSLARIDYRLVIALRVVMGISEAVAYPSMHSMWGRWAPIQERTKLTSFTYSGSSFGTIITYIVAGILCKEGFDSGWGSVFYVTGGVGILWCLCWFYLVSNTPETHPTITKAEKDYILQSIGNTSPKTFKVPWRSVLTSRPLWVCQVAHICNNWMHYTILTGLPTFMKEVLKFDIKQNGVLSSVPYMIMAVSTVSVGYVADYLRSRWLSTTATRRIFQSIGFLGSGSLIVGVGFVTCAHRDVAVVLLALAVGIEGFCFGGYMVNQVDFAPRYAGVLYGITNTISTIPGILAPLAIGALTPNKSLEEWRTVFYVCGGFCLLGAFVFGLFAQGEVEPWAMEASDDPEPKTEIEEDNKAKVNDAFQLGEGEKDLEKVQLEHIQ